MGFGDYTPSSGGYRKPVSKKELRKMQENYQKADKLTKIAREKEELEKQKTSQQFDDLFDELV